MSSKRLFEQSLIYGIGSIIVNASGFILIPIYTNFLSTSEYGILSSVALFSSLITPVLVLGQSGAVGRYYFELNDQNEWKIFFSTVSYFLLIFGLVITLFLYIFGETIFDNIFKSVRFDPYIKIGLWIAYFSMMPALPLALFQVRGQALTYRFLTTMSFSFLTIFMFLFVVWLKRGALGGLYAQLLAGIIMSMFYIYFIIREAFTKISFKYLKVALLFGLPLMIYSIFGIITEVASKYFIERFTTLSDLGVYNLAQQYSSGLILVVSALNMAWVPIFYEKAGDAKENHIFEIFGLYLVAFVTLLGLLMSLFANEFILFLAPKTYKYAANLIPVIILAYVFGNGLWILLVNPIFYSKQTKYLPWLTSISGVFCILSNILLVPKYGAMGAAISLLLSYILLVILAFYVANKLYPINYNYRKMFAMIAISIMIFCLSLWIKPTSVLMTILFKSCLFISFIFSLSFMKTLPLKELSRYFIHK